MLIASKTDDGVRISMIGEIMGENDWFASDALQMSAILNDAGSVPVSLWISSPGGSLDAAFAMRALLAEYPGKVTIYTAGIVASAATLMLCVPDAEVTALRGSVFMLHMARMVSAGNAEEMRKSADVLDICDDEIVKVYQLRLKCGEDELRNMLEAETWLRPEEAQALGLVDAVAQATSGGFIAEPKNPEPAEPEQITEAVSACITPRIEAIQSGLADIQARGEKRVQAITDAASAAVSGIVDASDKTVAGIVAVGEDVGKALAGELQAIRDEIAECRRSYDKTKEEYRNLADALSRAYALLGGDIGCTVHDENRRANGFKLNV